MPRTARESASRNLAYASLTVIVLYLNECFEFYKLSLYTIFTTGTLIMSETCVTCLKVIQKNKPKVCCDECKKYFHPRCAKVSSDELKSVEDDELIWRCVPCNKEHRRSLAIDTKSDMTYDDVIKLFNELKSQVKSVEQNLGDSLESCHQELKQNTQVIEEQNREIKKWAAMVEELTSENIQLKKRVVQLETRVEEAEQYSRANTIEIHGIPMQPSEDVIDVVKSVGEALDCPIEDSMIDACHRLGRKDRNGHPPGIILKMVRRFDAQKLLTKRREQRNFNTNHIGVHLSTSNPIYVNESLSPARRRLFNAAKNVKTEKLYTFLWIRGGKILMKKDENGPVKVIRHMEDLDKL